MCVTVTVGISPIWLVSGATLAAMRTASRRPRTWSVRSSGSSRSADWRLSPSSMVTKSSRPRSASVTRSAQYAAVSSSAGRASGSRQAAGCQPAPSSATARCTRCVPGTVICSSCPASSGADRQRQLRRPPAYFRYVARSPARSAARRCARSSGPRCVALEHSLVNKSEYLTFISRAGQIEEDATHPRRLAAAYRRPAATTKGARTHDPATPQPGNSSCQR